MTDTAVYSALATSILKGQLMVIGPLAVDQAKMVTGITVDSSNTIRITANGKETLTNLVKQFEKLFGKASIEVCKEAIKESQVSVADRDLPDILK